MSLDNLPPETLQKVFYYLQGNDLRTCSQVCKTWEPIANEATEQKWKSLCKSEFGQVYEKAYYKSRLSWQQLYRSLQLWPQLKSSKIYLHYSELLEGDVGYVPLDSKEYKQIQVIKNGIIGYPRYVELNQGVKKCGMGRWGECNSISYYDPDTMLEIETFHYNFQFDVYEENEDLIVLRGKTLDLYIVTKVNQHIHKVGQMVQNEWGDFSKFYLVRNKVFFINTEHKIWMCKLIFENGEATIKSAPFADFNVCPESNLIQAVAYINDNQVNILTCRGHIYSVVDQKLHPLCQVKKKMNNENEVVDILKQNGFDWSTPAVYRWICSRDIIDGDWVAITHLKNAVVHSHDCVVIIGTSRRTLHIYYNPYKDGQLKLFNKRPTIKIDLNEHIPYYADGDDYEGMTTSQRQILQIDVTEVENGHRIVMLYCQRLVTIELHHDPPLRPGEPIDYDHLATKPRCKNYFRIA